MRIYILTDCRGWNTHSISMTSSYKTKTTLLLSCAKTNKNFGRILVNTTRLRQKTWPTKNPVSHQLLELTVPMSAKKILEWRENYSIHLHTRSVKHLWEAKGQLYVHLGRTIALTPWQWHQQQPKCERVNQYLDTFTTIARTPKVICSCYTKEVHFMLMPCRRMISLWET